MGPPAGPRGYAVVLALDRRNHPSPAGLDQDAARPLELG